MGAANMGGAVSLLFIAAAGAGGAAAIGFVGWMAYKIIWWVFGA
jgi:hypothetical protein